MGERGEGGDEEVMTKADVFFIIANVYAAQVVKDKPVLISLMSLLYFTSYYRLEMNYIYQIIHSARLHHTRDDWFYQFTGDGEGCIESFIAVSEGMK